MSKKNIRQNKLDLELLTLIKSPCRECASRKDLPGCSKHCQTLRRLQGHLAGFVSCSNNFSEFETYTLSQ